MKINFTSESDRSALIWSLSYADHVKIYFIEMQILVHLHVNKTNFHMKGFELGLALKQRRKATRKWAIRARHNFLAGRQFYVIF